MLCLESLDQRFADAFWRFVEAGGYEMRERSSGRPEFFRFSGEGLDNAEASMYLGRRMVICIRYSRIIDNCSQS